MDTNFFIPRTPQENQITTNNYNYISLNRNLPIRNNTKGELCEKPVKFLKAKKLVFNSMHHILDP